MIKFLAKFVVPLNESAHRKVYMLKCTLRILFGLDLTCKTGYHSLYVIMMKQHILKGHRRLKRLTEFVAAVMSP